MQLVHLLRSSPETPASADRRSTSYVLNTIPQKTRSKEAVACMMGPMAVWMVKDKTAQCCCRTLYLEVWETTQSGKIRMCGVPELVRLAAETRDPKDATTICGKNARICARPAALICVFALPHIDGWYKPATRGTISSSSSIVNSSPRHSRKLKPRVGRRKPQYQRERTRRFIS